MCHMCVVSTVFVTTLVTPLVAVIRVYICPMCVAGLVTPLVAEKLLGSAGGILVLTMGAMALMSTGSGEVMAISSIVVYDIYQTYIRPFR
jgi:Na+/proline symporter